MDLLIVKVRGKFAHFRKFYTNSSSLSYSVPPRTVICGLLGAVMGYERDSYYDVFSRANLNIAVKKERPVRKVMQSLNYIKATSPKNILSPSDHTQIPVEIITDDGGIEYTIYINHADKRIMDELEYRVINNKYVFTPYLGCAPFSCVFDFIARVDGKVEKSDRDIYVSTLINVDYIVPKSINIPEGELKLLKERMPGEFTKGRQIGRAASYIYDENGQPIRLKIKNGFVSVKDENIVFM